MCSYCHRFVAEIAFVHVSWSCDVHHRFALGFAEDTIPRGRANGARTLTRQVTCPNPALHLAHQEVGLHTLLRQIRGLAGSADTAEERATYSRVTEAKLSFFRRFTTPTGMVDMSNDTDRGAEDLGGD